MIIKITETLKLKMIGGSGKTLNFANATRRILRRQKAIGY